MKEYESIHLVESADLNHHGTLFAARASAWFVEAGFIAAGCTYGNPKEIVLRSINKMSFVHPGMPGDMLCFTGQVVRLGTSSIVVSVEAENRLTNELILEGFLTFVCINETTRKKQAHGLTLTEADTPHEEERRREAGFNFK